MGLSCNYFPKTRHDTPMYIFFGTQNKHAEFYVKLRWYKHSILFHSMLQQQIAINMDTTLE